MLSNDENAFERPNQIQITELFNENSIFEFCSRHPDKKAKYSIFSGRERLCSKCALNHALKEGNIGLELSFKEKYKRDNLEILITSLHRNKATSSVFEKKIKEKFLFLEATHNQQSLNITRVFTRVINIVKETQKELQSQLDSVMALIKSKIQNSLDMVQVNQNEIDKLLSDITQNYQNIITEMKIDSFQEVSSLYQGKTSEIKEKLLNLANENYEYLIFEENNRQMQNFKNFELQKLFSLLKKTSFLEVSCEENTKNNNLTIFNNDDKTESSTDCTSLKKSTFSRNHSLHSDTPKIILSNASSLGINAKENSFFTANQSSKRNLVKTEEKTGKKQKNNVSVQMFRTEREIKGKCNSLAFWNDFAKKK